MKKKPKTIDDYLASVEDDDKRRALEELRASIRSIIPRAEECISYNMPAFRIDGEVVAGFLATAKGCSYYPFSGSTLRTLAEDVASYEQSKGSLHFSPKQRLPKAMIRKLLKTRMAESK